MNLIEFFLLGFITTTFLFTSFKTLLDFSYSYMDKKSNLRISEYKQKIDIDLYYESELLKIERDNNDFEL